MKKVKLKILLKGLLILGLFSFAAMSMYFYSVTSSLELEKITSSSPPASTRAGESDDLEQGSLVRGKDLKLFWAWNTYDLSYEEFFKSNNAVAEKFRIGGKSIK